MDHRKNCNCGAPHPVAFLIALFFIIALIGWR
jgi:hypothetical protein